MIYLFYYLSYFISDGWEKLGLYEYYKAKNSARKRKEEDIVAGIRQKSKSPSPILRPRSKSPSPPKKRYRSKSRSRSRSRSRGRSRSRSPTANHRRNSRNSNHNTRSRRRRNSNKDRSPERRLDRQDRSPTPPSFLYVINFISFVKIISSHRYFIHTTILFFPLADRRIAKLRKK